MEQDTSKFSNFDNTQNSERIPKLNISDILKFSLEKGILLDKGTLDLLNSFDEETAKNIIEKIASLKGKIITKSFFSNNVEKIQELIHDEKIIEKLKINLGLSLEISKEIFVKKEEILEKRELEAKNERAIKLGNIKVIYSLANASKKLEVSDFVRCFRTRYREMKHLLQERKDLEGLSSINKINSKRQSVSIIGIVFDKRITKNKNILLDIEDLTGKITILVNKNKIDVYDKAKEVLVDDVLGVRGFGNQEIIFANDIIWPDIFLHEKITLNRDERVAFISDIHIGSKNFLDKNFEKFIEWINGNVGDEKQKEEARKVKYLFITGDTIDGVGIFPGQEELLNIKDIKGQYKRLAEHLSKIRKDVKIIICPGQHDAVRVAEPQPPIGKDYASSLYELDNVILVSNPAVIEIGNREQRGVKILMYHGQSMAGLIHEIESLRLSKSFDHPSKVAREMLKRRHLTPLHGTAIYIPVEEDPLIIKEIPDIFATGDLHKADVDIYNNILTIASSCWQSTTPYEEKVGNHPDPCKVPVFNLKTREIKILDFSGEE